MFSKQNSISKKGIANDPSSHELSEGAPSSDNTALSATHDKPEEDAPSNKISEGAIPGKNARSTTAENNESIDDEERQWWIDMSTGEGSRKYVPQYLLDIKFNIEDEMKEMIVLAKECEKSLASNLSDEENEKKKSSFDKAFLKSFQKAVTKCQNLYPDIDKYEVEREVTRRLDYSVLSKLYQRYHKAYRDTLSSRQKLRDNLQ